MILHKLLRQSVSFQKSAIIRASQPIIYRVISQTQKYPTFIPWVNSSKILRQFSPNQNITQLTITYNNFKQLSYSSHVKMIPATKPGDKAIIHSICKDTPLKKLDSLWEIKAKDQSSSFVSYKLDFEFSSPLYHLASSILKDYMGQQLWNLFQKQSILQQIKAQNQLKVKRQSQSKRQAGATPQIIPNLKQQASAQAKQQTKAQQNNQSDEQCKILRLSQFLNQNPDLLTFYKQNTSTRNKIQQLHVRLQPMPDYQSQMQLQIRKLVSGSRAQNAKP